MQSRVALSETSPAPTMGTNGSAHARANPATPLRSVSRGMTGVSGAEVYAGNGNAYSDLPVNHRPGYTGYGAYEALLNGNFPATPQGTPGVGSPYNNSAYGNGNGNTNTNSSQFYWAAPYLTDQALTVPTMAYYRPDTNYSPMAPSTQDQTQAHAPTSIPRAMHQAGTPTRAASQDELFKSEAEGEDIKSAKSA